MNAGTIAASGETMVAVTPHSGVSVHGALTRQDLAHLIQQVFQPTDLDNKIVILVDLPDERVPDESDWRIRRLLAKDWLEKLQDLAPRLGLEPELVLYRNVGSDNADLPEIALRYGGGPLPQNADELHQASLESFESIFERCTIMLALTHFSATAPLKIAAKIHLFRAATMPGFTIEMIPALCLDYALIQKRVKVLKERLDCASGAEVDFSAGGQEFSLYLDLRHRKGISSDGLLREPGKAANLPSGESCIAPYEGERIDDPSQSFGTLPVQFRDEVVLFRIENNRAVTVLSRGKESRRQSERLADEPAYGNIAELGLGILSDFGIRPIGETLLDEKLGLHIAFGRSDHLGGQVGAADFSKPGAVVHVDWIYLLETQPLVRVRSLTLMVPGAKPMNLISRGEKTEFFSNLKQTKRPPSRTS